MISYPRKLRDAARIARQLGEKETELITLAVPGCRMQLRVSPSVRSRVAELMAEIIKETRKPNAS